MNNGHSHIKTSSHKNEVSVSKKIQAGKSAPVTINLFDRRKIPKPVNNAEKNELFKKIKTYIFS